VDGSRHLRMQIASDTLRTYLERIVIPQFVSWECFQIHVFIMNYVHILLSAAVVLTRLLESINTSKLFKHDRQRPHTDEYQGKVLISRWTCKSLRPFVTFT
jgi:hypothetical protein